MFSNSRAARERKIEDRVARLESRFIATIFSVYDAGTRRLTLANSGGPYPILVRDGVVQSIRVGGIPLGLYPDTEYEEITLDLQPGDTVLFASDGILESENAQQEEFGFDRLSAVLTSVSPKHTASDIAIRLWLPQTITVAKVSRLAMTEPSLSYASSTTLHPIFPSCQSSTDMLLNSSTLRPGSVRRNRDTFALNATSSFQ